MPRISSHFEVVVVGCLVVLLVSREAVKPEYLHNIKPVAVGQWLRSLRKISNGSKSQIRNIMSGIFSHAIRYELADKNSITAVRQSGKREKIPVVLDIAELHRLFDELELRERTMIVCDALTGMRRSELMGLKWSDLARRVGINKKIGWHTFRHTFSTLIKSMGIDAKVHASFKTTMDGYTQALEPPKRQASAGPGRPDHAHG